MNGIKYPNPDQIAVNRLVAYRGEIGNRREEFCNIYSLAKKWGIAAVEKQLCDGVKEMGKQITCRKGCSYCCKVYVFADLQECEAIVHYLYRNEELLKHFLEHYYLWKDKISGLGRVLPELDSVQEKMLLGSASLQDRDEFSKRLNAYAGLQNPCPFLKDNACTIYEVRPYVCAGVISTSPVEYCEPEHPKHDDTILYKADFQPQEDMPYFIETKCAVNFGCMPELVYRIIKYGYGFLSSIAGLENMQRTAGTDPEIKSLLERMGVKPNKYSETR
jgi:Fe-S-cluster containining protein